jgi:hypothetical protein
VGLLRRAGEQLTEYLYLRDEHLRVPEQLRYCWSHLESQVRAVTEQLEAGGWPDVLLVQLEWEPGIAPEGRMHWCETWSYPSQNLLLYRDGEGPYFRRREDIPRHLPMLSEGHLQACLVADGQRLLVEIPLNPVPWCYPRVVWKKFLEPAAKREGRRVRRAQKAWLAQYSEPLGKLGQRVWLVQANNETPAEELLASLVIVAEKESFPISEDDRQAAWTWIHHAMRDGFRSKNQNTYTALIDDLVPEVYARLVSRFDLPPTDWSFRGFIQETARGLAKTMLNAEREQRGVREEPESRLDPTSGLPLEMVYPPAWIVQEIEVSKRKVYRWMEQNGFDTAPSGRRALREEQLAAFKQDLVPGTIRQFLRQRGFSPEAAKKKVQRWQGKGRSAEEMVHMARQVYPKRNGQE